MIRLASSFSLSLPWFRLPFLCLLSPLRKFNISITFYMSIFTLFSGHFSSKQHFPSFVDIALVPLTPKRSDLLGSFLLFPWCPIAFAHLFQILTSLSEAS